MHQNLQTTVSGKRREKKKPTKLKGKQARENSLIP